KRGQSDKRKDALDVAGQDAPELEGVPTLIYVLSRVYYFEHIGDTEAALKELNQASLRPETSDLVNRYAVALYEQGRDTDALDVLNKRLKPGNMAGQSLQIILRLEQREITPDEAYDALTASLKQEGKSGGIDSFTLL